MNTTDRDALCRRAVAALGLPIVLKGNHFVKDGYRWPVAAVSLEDYAIALEDRVGKLVEQLRAAHRAFSRPQPPWESPEHADRVETLAAISKLLASIPEAS